MIYKNWVELIKLIQFEVKLGNDFQCKVIVVVELFECGFGLIFGNVLCCVLLLLL